MNIVSLLYLAFVAVVALAYFITPRRFRWVTLLIASVANYLSYDPKLAVWMFITSVTIYVGGLLIDRQEQKFAAQLKVRTDLDRAGKRALKKQNERVKKRWAALVAAVNIAIWVVFKFADLFITALNKYLSGNLSLWHLVLPLGISFYTLQAISYVVDLSRGKCKVQRNYFKLLLWLCFFPQMLQGPICRYRETAPQLYEPHDFDYRRVKFGMQRMLWGYFKKLVIADRVVSVSEKVFGNSGDYQGLVFVIGALAYTIQIYADFSGGMDIISGAAEILGVNMPVNFERPYFSKSISEYWRRWHITLGAWFRDYVFYPLSISRWAQKLTTSLRKRLGPNIAKMIPTYLAMVLVWMLNGIWHGAGWQFVAFGMYQGILIVLGMQFEPVFDWII
ncbi:MAG: MBOAT family O-acyltransferase, partial [Eubacteriales bacterium]